ncbi:MAG: hypothetical protein IJP63_07190 [Acholeplasmatales bacterium]|nr:hypothetical protein [Acholeplasmatales bacterium]
MKKKKTNTDEEIEIEEQPGSKIAKIPSWILITIVKYWAAAAAVFFIIIGGSDIGFDFTEVYDDPRKILSVSGTIILLIALFSALFQNYVTKLFARALYSRRNNTRRFVVYNQKGFSAFIFYLAYCFLLGFALFFIVTYLGYKGLIFDPFGTTGGAGIEPFSYALFYVILDTLVIIIKNTVINIYQKIKYNKQMKNNEPILIEAQAE